MCKEKINFIVEKKMNNLLIPREESAFLDNFCEVWLDFELIIMRISDVVSFLVCERKEEKKLRYLLFTGS